MHKSQTYIGVQGPHFRDLFRREVNNTDETAIARECQKILVCADFYLAKPTQESGMFLRGTNNHGYLIENIVWINDVIE